ncbi:MAG TPA: DinB family protein [Dehalococcoidia bacterium]|nr:DinB family protein [Dehalococcoidia bacterium]
MPPRTRQELVAMVDAEWRGLMALLDGLPEEAMLRPGAVGRWSARDLLCHIATWEEEFLQAAPVILEGRPLPRYGSIDAFNARDMERWQGLSLAEAWQRARETHRRLLECLQTLPHVPGRTESRLRRRLRWDTWGHYQEHAAQLREWRRALEGATPSP